VGKQRRNVDLPAGRRRDHGTDDLAESAVGHAEDDDVVDGVVLEQRFLDFGREHLLATGVHDRGESAEQVDGTVAARPCPVARHHIAVSADRREGLLGLLRVAVVPLGEDASEGQDAEGSGIRLNLVALFVQQYRPRRDHQLGGQIIRAPCDAECVRAAFARGEHVDDGDVAERVQAALDVVAEAHARADDRVHTRKSDLETLGGFDEREGERIPGDDQTSHLVVDRQPKRFFDVHPRSRVQHDGAAEREGSHGRGLGSAVQEGSERERDDTGGCRVQRDADRLIEVGRRCDPDQTPGRLLPCDQQCVEVPDDRLRHARRAACVQPQLRPRGSFGGQGATRRDDVHVAGGASDRATIVVDGDDLDGGVESADRLEGEVGERRGNDQDSQFGVEDEVAHLTGPVAIVDGHGRDADGQAGPREAQVLRAVVQQHSRRIPDRESSFSEMPRQRAGFGREAPPRHGVVAGDDRGAVRIFPRDALPQVAVVRGCDRSTLEFDAAHR
jgi:hypothetical protein